MKPKTFILSLLSFLLLLTNCNKEDDEITQDGILEYRSTTWNKYYSEENKSTKSQTTGNVHTLDIIDVKSFKSEIAISTVEVSDEVAPGSIEWIPIYESDKMKLDSEIRLSSKIPAGHYKSIRVTFVGNTMYWVCLFNGDTIDIPGQNSNVQYFADGGYYGLNNNAFTLIAPGERLGTFEIMPNKVTKVTARINMITLTWHDNDGSGDWSNGDDVSNITVPDGVTTMSDFIVEYPDNSNIQY